MESFSTFLEPLTKGDILVVLCIIAVLLAIMVLYNVLFLIVGVRSVVKRLQQASKHVEEIIMKPVALAENVLDWVAENAMNEDAKPKPKKTKTKKSKKS